jgi:beta-fructofuranosidase
MLKLNNNWIWDFWFAEDGETIHIFYLQAPKSLGDERKRHHNATIGHAKSNDLINWEILDDALKPGDPGTWDDLATWTGSVIKKADKWFMFYTGVNKKEKGLIQRIGLATSTDLITWERYSQNPIMEADEKWYEKLDLNLWHDEAWRDPFVVQFDNEYYAYITSRINKGPRDGRGVIALAKSRDFFNWEIMPPISEPGEFGQLEVPQYIKLRDKHLLLFSSAIETTSKERKARVSNSQIKTGMFYLTSNSPQGVYKLPADALLVGDSNGSLYSGKIIMHKNSLKMLAFHNYDSDGNFIGKLSDPFSINFKSIL